MEGLIGRLQPDLVLSPAYEGGHPDHDAAAFAVALVRKSIKSFRHWEYPLYHANRKGRMITGKFIARPDDGRETVISLSEDEKSLKSRMLACFETQQEIINRFRVKSERFRPAPAYDFTRPPHPGPLQYERWGWGITGAEWRRRAREALAR
jgi:LmbE family N-acetylglucosaminyl deacetylase